MECTNNNYNTGLMFEINEKKMTAIYFAAAKLFNNFAAAKFCALTGVIRLCGEQKQSHFELVNICR